MSILPTTKLVKFLALFCSSGALLLLLFPITTTAAFTKQINYQGKLTNASGVAVTDGSRAMTFRLYASSTGGVALWSEVDSVTTTGGLFSLMLGAISTLDSVDFNQPLYLSLEVESDGEMTPRKTLGSVANAFNSLNFDGFATSSFLRSDIVNATGTINHLNSDSLTVSGNMTAGSITLNGVTRTSWPGGGSGTDVNWSYNPLTDTLTPATSTSGILVNGTSTLSTTTMALGSSFGQLSGTNMSIIDLILNDLGDFAVLDFFSPNYSLSSVIGGGGVMDGWGIIEKNNNPAIYFAGKDINLADLGSGDAHVSSIIYSTTSQTLTFGSAKGGYIFDESLDIPAGKCLSLDGVCTGATSWLDNGQTLYVGDVDKNLLFGDANIFGSTTQGLFMIGGTQNYASSSSGGGGIIGGARNHLEDGGLIITTGADNYSDTGGVIIGAGLSTSTSGYVFGGYLNYTHDNFNSAIVGGAGNESLATNGGIFAGEGNTAVGWRSVIMGGQDNTTMGLASGIYNGTNNAVYGAGSSILGGENNVIGTSTWGAVILGGRDSEVSGFYSSVLAGNNNIITGSNSITLDGSHNTITADDADIIGGRRNWITGTGSYTFGSNMTVTGGYSMGFGLAVVDPNSTSSNYVITQNNVMAIMGGRVGIGVTSPSEVLDVNGNIQISKGNFLKYNGVNLAYSSTTLSNYFFGNSGNLLMRGTNNIAMGDNALASNTEGLENFAIGPNALSSNALGNLNIAIGSDSLYSVFNAANNIAVGHQSLRNNIYGDGNTAFGSNSGFNAKGSAGLFLGYNADLTVLASSSNNAIAIGYNAKVGGSNMMALGGLDADAVAVGISTSTPAYALVVGSGHIAEGLKSVQVPYGSLCVDNDGWCTPNGTPGTISAVGYTTGNSDLAENYEVFEFDLVAGDIVSASSLNTASSASLGASGLRKATKSNDILGIVSTAPGVTLGLPNDDKSTNKLPVALSGRVPVKVNLEGGDINIGDRITLSTVPGIGTKATSSTQTVGIALESFNSSSPQTNNIGQVLVFVNLGFAHLDPQINQTLSASNLWSLNETTGQIKAQSSVSLGDFDLVDVRSISSIGGGWSIDEKGNLKVNSIEISGGLKIGSPEKRIGFTLYDEQSGEPYCISVSGGGIKNTKGECGLSGAIITPDPIASTSTNPIATGTPPLLDSPSTEEASSSPLADPQPQIEPVTPPEEVAL